MTAGRVPRRHAAPAASRPAERGDERRLHRLPAAAAGRVWLALFFVVPIVSLVSTQPLRPDGVVLAGYTMTWHFQNYVDAMQTYWPLFVRSLALRRHRDAVCLILGFPLAYAIAFKAGRWRT